MAAIGEDAWVFGYGSLMWDPGFPFLERHPALLQGWHRAFSLVSHEAWGSAEKPGLVLALHPGGACRATAFRVAAADWPEVEAYLQQRERAYRHIEIPVRLPHGRVRALTFAHDPAHPRYVGKLPLRQSAELIVQGVGHKGSSLGYLRGTYHGVRDMGFQPEPLLRNLMRAVLDAGAPPDERQPGGGRVSSGRRA